MSEAMMYILKLIDVQEEKLSESEHLIDEERCFVVGGFENPHWVCRNYRETVYVKDGKLIVDKYYLNCTQAHVVDPDENPQYVLCSTLRLSYIYELVPVDRSELIQKMRRIVENVRACKSVLAGELLYAVRVNNKLYVLVFSYNPILNCIRAEVKYVLE